MKYILIITTFILHLNVLSQYSDTCFTEKEIHLISETLDSLYYIDSVNNEIINTQQQVIKDQDHIIYYDSIQQVYYQQQIDLLKNNIDIYIDREKLLQKKWYQKPIFWFAGGIATTLLTGKMISIIIQ